MPSHLQEHVLPAYEDAQRRAIALLGDVVPALEPGMTERDAEEAAAQLASGRGFVGWFHPPQVRFDRGLRPLAPASSRRALAPGALVQLNLAPATEDAFGEVGITLAFQAAEPPRVVQEARDLCRATCGFASRWKCVGELFVFAKSWANNRRLQLDDVSSIGHACFPREGLTAAAWPRAARAATLLRRNQIQWYNPRRMAGVYAVHPPLSLGGQAAAFKELIFVDEDTKVILGRQGPDDIGTW